MINDGTNPFLTTKIKPDTIIYLKGEYGISEDTLSKLQGAMKLAELAENEHEAANAAQMVQKIIQKYNIDLGDIAFADGERPQVVEKFWYSTGKNKNSVQANLAHTLGKYNFVEVYTTSQYLLVSSSGRMSEVFSIGFVGREKNVDMVMALFNTVRIRLNKLSAVAFQEYVNEQNKEIAGHEHGKSWKSSWLQGAIAGIRETLIEQQREFENIQSANGNTGKALIVSLNAENKEYLKNYAFTQNKGSRISNWGAYRSGMETGKSIGIKPVIGK